MPVAANKASVEVEICSLLRCLYSLALNNTKRFLMAEHEYQIYYIVIKGCFVLMTIEQ